MSIDCCIPKFFRKIFSSFLFFAFSTIALFGADFAVRIAPNPVLENQLSRFTIVLADGEQLNSVEFPEIDGIRWVTNSRSSQTSIVNGSVTSSVGYGFIVSKTGTLSIPRVKITTNKGTRWTQAVSFTVGKASSGVFDESGAEIPLEKAVSLHIQLADTSRNAFFIGEDIPVYVIEISEPAVSVSPSSVPALVAGSAFSLQQTENAVLRQLSIGNKNVNGVIFPMKLQAMKAGTFDADFFANANCTTGGNTSAIHNAFDDPFFSNRGFFGRNASAPIAISLKGTLKNIEIKNRPSVPAGIIDLGVITSRPLKWSFSTKEAKQGDPVYLDLQISGNPSGFKAPEISLDGFRSYPAEMTEIPATENTEALTKVRLMLIPLRAGEEKISLKFATLDPISGAYKIAEVDQELKVSENKNLATSVPATSVPAARAQNLAESVPVANEKILSNNINYIRHLDAGTLAEQRAPWKFWEMLFVFCSALVLWSAVCGIVLFAIFWAKKRSASPNALRRSRARARKSEILKKLSAATEENFDALVRTEIADYIADSQGVASFDEVRSSMKNVELAEVVQAAETAGYNPNARCGNVEKFKKILIKAIKNSAFLAIGGFVFFAGENETFAAGKISVPAEIEAAESSYASGKFSDARAAYENLATIAPFSPDVWFNLGNAHYQQKDFSAALLCYERAYRLALKSGAARTSYILPNLNATRMQLGLPQRNEVKTPIDFFLVIRDELPQGMWLAGGFILFAGATLFVIFVGVRKKRRGYICGGLIFGGLSLGVGIFNFISQERELFDPQDGIVLAENAALLNIPIEKTAKKIGNVPAGNLVKIIGARERWLLVKTSANSEGWISKNDIAKIWSDFTVPAERK